MWSPKGTTLRVIRCPTLQVSQFLFPGQRSDTFLTDHVHTYIHTYIPTYTHTHTHTYTHMLSAVPSLSTYALNTFCVTTQFLFPKLLEYSLRHLVGLFKIKERGLVICFMEKSRRTESKGNKYMQTFGVCRLYVRRALGRHERICKQLIAVRTGDVVLHIAYCLHVSAVHV